MDLVTDLFDRIRPELVEILVILLGGIIGAAGLKLRQKFGIDVQLGSRQMLDEALHRILTGALDRSLTRDQIIDVALAYLKSTIPAALRSLGVTDAQLRDRIATEVAAVRQVG